MGSKTNRFERILFVFEVNLLNVLKKLNVLARSVTELDAGVVSEGANLQGQFRLESLLPDLIVDFAEQTLTESLDPGGVSVFSVEDFGMETEDFVGDIEVGTWFKIKIISIFYFFVSNS